MRSLKEYIKYELDYISIKLLWTGIELANGSPTLVSDVYFANKRYELLKERALLNRRLRSL